MSHKFFGFAISDSMFHGDIILKRQEITVEQLKEELKEGIIPCLNPSHAATIAAMKARYGIEVEIPETAPRCSLESGDALLLMQVRGLPRLDATRHEYTEEEIASATFTFSKYSVES